MHAGGVGTLETGLSEGNHNNTNTNTNSNTNTNNQLRF